VAAGPDTARQARVARLALGDAAFDALYADSVQLDHAGALRLVGCCAATWSATCSTRPEREPSRVALVGDAGYCASSLYGMGTGLAVVGAYVLAGELAAAQGDTGPRSPGTRPPCGPMWRVPEAGRRAGPVHGAEQPVRGRVRPAELQDAPASALPRGDAGEDGRRTASAITLPTYPG
jgi:hypothetical protein